MSCLFCGGSGCRACTPPTPSTAWPGCTPTQAAWVRDGRHPLGHRLPAPEGATCGGCAHLVRQECSKRVYLKCALARQSCSAATDTRARWPGCEKWRKREND